MLGPWETVWLCIGLTLFVLVVDALQAHFSKPDQLGQPNGKQVRQTGMKYTQMEDLKK